MSIRLLSVASTVLIAVGVVLLLFFAYHLSSSNAGHRAGIDAFEQARTERAEQRVTDPEEAQGDAAGWSSSLEQPAGEAVLIEPDMRDWSASRIAAYASEESGANSADVPEGVMRIPSVNLEVPVFSGTSEPALTLGAGRIEGTPPLGSPGNTGIAAHRDGWFRALKDVQVGDSVEVDTLDDERVYRVTELLVVEPRDVHVLAPTESDSLTLVTCFPFYFVGSAPQRYIVRAEIVRAERTRAAVNP